MYKFLIIVVLGLTVNQVSAEVLSYSINQKQNLLSGEVIIKALQKVYVLEVSECESVIPEITLDPPETLELIIDSEGIRAVLTQFYTVTCSGQPINCVELETGDQNGDTICPIRHENALKKEHKPPPESTETPEILST